MNLRVLLWSDCYRECPGCCNKDWDLPNLPVLTDEDIAAAGMIMLTGGEPFLYPDKLMGVLDGLFLRMPQYKVRADRPPVYIYTAFPGLMARNLASPDPTRLVFAVRDTLARVDGLTVTLHAQSDVSPFLRADAFLAPGYMAWSKSLRLNIFSHVQLPADARLACNWKIKTGIEWVKNCPLPANEKFVRLGEP